MISDEQVEEVRARADLVDLVGEVVPLKKSGKDFKGKCPFHDDRTPSFYVVPTKGIYKCFGCGESGDVFSFFMKRQGMDFLDAVRHVAQRAGVALNETTANRAEEEALRPLKEANHFARDFFHQQLLDPSVGRRARAYLEKRGIRPEIWERFELGYAPDEWRALRDAAAGHGMEDEVLEVAGLLGRSDKNPEPYDRFRDRIIFPIHAMGGQVVAFGARVLDGAREGAPKYLNSPETPLYTKGTILYGLHGARHLIRKEGVAVVVEGYMDLVALAAHGLETVVATLGTALTTEQAELLRRYTSRAMLLFDSDAAGLKATFRAGDALLAARVHPSVVTLPRGEDPDSVVGREGAKGLQVYLDQAVDVLDRKLQLLEERDYFSTLDQTRTAVDRLLPTLRAAADPTLRDLYIARVAERTGVRRETLEQEVASAPPPSIPQAGSHGHGAGTAGGGARMGGGGRFRSAPALRMHTLPPSWRMGGERALLMVLLRDRSWLDRAAERVGPDDFRDPAYRNLFQALLDDPDLQGPSEGMEPSVARRLVELNSDPEALVHAGRIFEDAVGEMLRHSGEQRLRDLDARMKATDDPKEQEALAQEKLRIRREAGVGLRGT
ncbi:MAG: DNA primase [Gemmatimonadota bacterium]